MVTGPIARELSQKYSCKPGKVASIIDISSCIVQGLIPYGAQLLIAIGIARQFDLNLSGFHLITHMYYQILLIFALLVSILFFRKRMEK